MMKDKIAGIIGFFKETRGEMRKVVWPGRRYVAVASTVILVLSFITGIYVMFVDFIFTKLFGVLLK